jgi:hypothetical protein
MGSTEHVDSDDDSHTKEHPDCAVNMWVPVIYEETQESSSGQLD